MAAVTIRGVIATTVLPAGQEATVERTESVDRLIAGGYAVVVSEDPHQDHAHVAADGPQDGEVGTQPQDEPEGAQDDTSVPEDAADAGQSVPDDKPRTVKRSPRKRK